MDYDCRPADATYADLIILCNGCGEAMRPMGEWPVQFPRDDNHKHFHQSFRYTCKTCRTPHKAMPNKGIPVMVTIMGKS